MQKECLHLSKDKKLNHHLLVTQLNLMAKEM